MNMLLQKQITPGSVVSMKLVNGDEIIARYESEDDRTITINRPLALTMGANGLGMIPWLFLGDTETFSLKREHVFVMVMSKKEAADQYLTGTTGIALR
jgi:hypothetical protein